jgi:hypothetical protein
MNWLPAFPFRAPGMLLIICAALFACSGASGSGADRVAPPGQSWKKPRLPSVAFVVSCSASHQRRDDPIRHFAKPGASHLHTFFGNRATDASSSWSSLSISDTTCNNVDDRAAYWLPSPTNGRWKGLRAYYSAGGLEPSSIESYPDSFALISNRGDSRSVSWSCSSEIDGEGWTPSPPDCRATGRSLTVRIVFPQCANTKVTSFVEPSRGRCPKGHPRAFPLLRLRVVWEGTSDGPRALSSGPLRSMHADFLNGWNTDVVDRLVAVCIRGERTSNVEIKICGIRGTGPASV